MENTQLTYRDCNFGGGKLVEVIISISQIIRSKRGFGKLQHQRSPAFEKAYSLMSFGGQPSVCLSGPYQRYYGL
jgi:hypothetical protein